MEIVARSTNPLTLKTDCLVVAVTADKKFSPTTASIDKACDGLISRRLEGKDISGECGSTLMLHEPAGISAKRLLLVGTGSKTLSTQEFLKIARSVAKLTKSDAIASVATTLAEVEASDQDVRWTAQQLAQQFGEASYAFNGGKPPVASKLKLKKVTLLCSDRKTQSAAQAGLNYGEAVAIGVNQARLLGDLAANTCTPSYLAKYSRALARKQSKLSCQVLSEKQMADLGMGSLLSVTAGTEEPAHLIALDYKGGKKGARPIVLVGKGVTFDSGGISLKPGGKMDEMKYDMCGAASVLGVMEALATADLPINVIGVVPAVENMPSGKATKPGDVVTSMSGQTIEVLNTDAEGRLILCDALTYVARYKPDTVIDIATLTGACIVALGSHASGLYSNDDDLAKDLLDAGQSSGDRAWQMPLWDEYNQQLKTNFADMGNIGGAGGGSITAACFLSRFTKDYRWAHLDIAGTAWLSAGPKGATGRPVPLLMEYLRNRASA
ncbi:leucyl aminopeptidase [Gammaproteobacteria bacterium 50_400_T64]|nr:leucyl aminopeptidase [Gammaproteobacteria bacterium 50_400_T64]